MGCGFVCCDGKSDLAKEYRKNNKMYGWSVAGSVPWFFSYALKLPCWSVS